MILFYADKCRFCDGVIPAAATYCAEKGITLTIRKPTLTELPLVKGFPSLYIPESNTLIIGDGLIEELKSHG